MPEYRSISSMKKSSSVATIQSLLRLSFFNLITRRRFFSKRDLLDRQDIIVIEENDSSPVGDAVIPGVEQVAREDTARRKVFQEVSEIDEDVSYRFGVLLGLEVQRQRHNLPLHVHMLNDDVVVGDGYAILASQCKLLEQRRQRIASS